MPFLKIYKEHFPIKLLGTPSMFVGMDIKFSPGMVSLSSQTYISRMVPKFVSKEDLIHPCPVPATITDSTGRIDSYSKFELEPSDIDLAAASSLPFLSGIASCLYACCTTRVDIAFHCSKLSRYCNCVTKDKYNMLITLMRYMYQTRKLCLTYGGPIKVPLVPSCRPPLDPADLNALCGIMVFSDSSWKTGSTYRGHFILCMNAAVDWASSLMKVMAMQQLGS